ncbi:MAG: hypothetical protein KUG75_16165 [Pseudomonadales bacterium]|nr:hypothetical protein [Pseudomonadales bacterium]
MRESKTVQKANLLIVPALDLRQHKELTHLMGKLLVASSQTTLLSQAGEDLHLSARIESLDEMIKNLVACWSEFRLPDVSYKK